MSEERDRTRVMYLAGMCRFMMPKCLGTRDGVLLVLGWQPAPWGKAGGRMGDESAATLVRLLWVRFFRKALGWFNTEVLLRWPFTFSRGMDRCLQGCREPLDLSVSSAD